MFDSSSRYYNLSNEIYNAGNGEQIVYVSRRFLPMTTDQTPITQVTVNAGDRLDLISNRVFNDPLLYWQIADANNAMDPFDLTEQPGTVLQILASTS